MLTQLRIQNFKSWHDTGTLRIAPLTGLFGTNSSGKTSILQMLLMLKQTVESPDRHRVLHFGDERSLVDLGTFYDVIHRHATAKSLAFDLSWQLPKALEIRDSQRRAQPLITDHLSFGAELRLMDQRLVVDQFEYMAEAFRFGMQREDQPSAYRLTAEGYTPRRTQGRPWPLPDPVKCYGFPDEATAYFQNTGFLPDFELAFEKLFANIKYLGPLRDYPRRSYTWAGERPIDVGRRGELAVPALLASRTLGKTISAGPRKRRKTVEARIGEWLEVLQLGISLSLEAIAEHRKDYELRVVSKAGGAEVLITDVGFGVSQILPVLVLCYYVPEGSIIILEQPEIHLHPSVQAGLADVLVDVVNTRNVQVIVESHSEHLLTRLQRRIAEERITREQVALYFCRLEQGESRLDELQLDLFGNITNWPAGFFGDEIGDRLAITENTIRRQMRTGA